MTPTTPLDRAAVGRLAIDSVIYAGFALCLMMSTSDIAVAVPSAVSHLWVTGVLASAVLFVLGHRREAGMVGITAILIAWVLEPFGPADEIWALCQIGAFLLMIRHPVSAPARPLRQAGLVTIAVIAWVSLALGPQTSWYLAAIGGMLAAPFLPALTLGIGVVFAANTLLDAALSPATFGASTWHSALGIVQLIDLPLALLAVLAFHGPIVWASARSGGDAAA